MCYIKITPVMHKSFLSENNWRWDNIYCDYIDNIFKTFNYIFHQIVLQYLKRPIYDVLFCILIQLFFLLIKVVFT